MRASGGAASAPITRTWLPSKSSEAFAAFGNSDGDFEMLEWTTSGTGPRLGLILHHDDSAREWAYDRDSGIGRLARGLDEAPTRGWRIVSMKDDWKRIHP